jgi:hypothetical protein
MSKFDKELWDNEGEWRKYMTAVYQSLNIREASQ